MKGEEEEKETFPISRPDSDRKRKKSDIPQLR